MHLPRATVAVCSGVGLGFCAAALAWTLATPNAQALMRCYASSAAQGAGAATAIEKATSPGGPSLLAAAAASLGLPRLAARRILGIPLPLAGVLVFGFLLVVEAGAALGGTTGRDALVTLSFLWSLLLLAWVILEIRWILAAGWPGPALAVLLVSSLVIFLALALGEGPGLLSMPGVLVRGALALVRTPAAVATALALIAALAAVVQYGPSLGRPRRALPTPAEFEEWFASRPRRTLTELTEGARVVVVKFNDYQCPPCRRAYLEYTPVIRRLQARHPGDVRYVVRDFPLDSDCNPSVHRRLHPAACDAAAALRIARDAGHELEFERWLFENQESLTPGSVRERLVSLLGRPPETTEMAAALAGVRRDVEIGQKLEVSGTPTLFVNGVQMGLLSASLLEAALEHELRERRSDAATR